MRKLLTLLGFGLIPGLVMAAESAPAVMESPFQKFDNQFSIGFGGAYGNLTNTYGQNTNYGTTMVVLSVERLFDIGVWARVDASLMTGYSNFNSSNPNAVTAPLGQDAGVANLNAKVGYAFQMVDDHFMVAPYVLAGRNTNLTSSSLTNNMSPAGGGTQSLNSNVTQDYFLTGGVGARVEYRVNTAIELYADQNILYNSDQSQPNSNYNSASNYEAVSTIGAKFNVWRRLQLGVQGFYSYSQLSGTTTSSQAFQLYPQNQIGGFATIGMTY